MDNENKEQVSNTETIVLGELKKEKSSKPILALIIMFLILSICFGLPYISDYLNDNNPISNLYHKYILKDMVDDNSDTDDSLKMLTNDLVLNINNKIFVSDISITSDYINYAVSSREVLDLDNSNYYFIIYNESKSLIYKSKLSGTISNVKRMISEKNVNNIKSNNYYVEFREG